MNPTSTAFRLDEAIEILQRTPALITVLLADLSAPWTEARERPSTWSAREIVAHLIEGERTDWIPRARRILDHGTAVPFDPFDRAAHLGGEPKPLADLLATFADLRRENVAALRALELEPADLRRSGTHPALGSVTLAELLAAWTVHDLTHVSQIVRTLASRYRAAVGPWNDPSYLGILQERQ